MNNEHSPKMLKLNRGVAKGIISWINHISANFKLKHIKELKDCHVFMHLLNVILPSMDQDVIGEFYEKHRHLDTNSLDQQYTFVLDVCHSLFRVEGQFDADSAKRGNEFELAKLAMVILINGTSRYIEAITRAYDNIEGKDFEPIEQFYTIAELYKSKLPPVDLAIYEAHLSMADDKRKSLSREATHSNSGTPRSSKSVTNSPANYLLSPMQRANLNSPAACRAKRKIEEDYSSEIKKLERDIKNKEFYIEDLLYQLKEKSEAFEKIADKNKEIQRRMCEMGHDMDKVSAYESTMEKMKKMEVDKGVFDEKYKKQKAELQSLKEMLNAKQGVEKRLEDLSKENEILNNKNHTFLTELKNLREVEAQLARLVKECDEKESKICQLLEKSSFYENQLKSSTEKFNFKISELSEKNEQLGGEYAAIQCEINSLRAQLTNAKNDHDEEVSLLKIELKESSTANETLQAQVAKLCIEIKEKTGRLEKVESENVDLKTAKQTVENKLSESETSLISLEKECSALNKNHEAQSKKMQEKIGDLTEKLSSLSKKLALAQNEAEIDKNLSQQKCEAWRVTEEELKADKEMLKSRVQELEAHMKEYSEETNVKLAENKKSIDSLAKINFDLETNLNSLKEEHESLQQKYDSKTQSLNQELSELSDARDELMKSLHKSQSELTDLAQKSEREIKTLNSKVEQLSSQNATLESKIANKLNEYSSYSEEASSRIKSLETSVFDYKKQTSDLSKKLLEANNKFDELSAQSKKTIDQLNKNINELNATLNQRVSELNKAHDEHHDFKDQTERKILSLNAQIDELSELSSGLQNKLTKANEDSERYKAEMEHQVEFLTKNVEILNENKSFLEQNLSAKQNDYDVLCAESNQRIEELEKNINELTEQNSQLAKSLSHTEQTFAQFKTDSDTNIDQLNDELSSKQTQIAQLEQSLAESNSDVSQLSSRLENQKSELESKEKDFANLQQYLNDMQRDHEEENKQYEADIENIKNEALREKTELNEKLNVCNEEMCKLSQDLEESMQSLRNLEEQLNENKAKNEADKKQLLLELEQSYSEQNLKLNEISKLEGLLQEETLKYDELKNQLSEKQEQAENMLVEMQQSHSNEIAKLGQELSTLKEDLAQKKSEIERLQTEKEGLSVNIQEVSAEKQRQVEKYEMERQELQMKCESLENEILAQKQNSSGLQNQVNEMSQKLSQYDEYVQQLSAEKARWAEREQLFESEMQKLQQVKQELQNELAQIQNELSSYKNESQQLKQANVNGQHELSAKLKENSMLRMEIDELNKKILEREVAFNQMLTDKETELKDLYTRPYESYKNHIGQLENELMSVKTQYRAEEEKREMMDRRAREEIALKQNDIESLKQRVKSWEEKDKVVQSQLSALQEANKNLIQSEETHKQLIGKQQQDFEKAIKQKEDYYQQLKSVKEYVSKFEEHYKAKKAKFEEADEQLKEYGQKLFVAEKENTELRNKVIQSEGRIRGFIEENNCLKEKIKTLNFESQQLDRKNSELLKYINEKVEERTTTMLPPMPQSARFASLSTPKQQMFMDDFGVKYTDAHEILNNPHYMSHDELSRRFSIDSMRMSNVSSTPSVVMPAFNRFNAISEHEFEESVANHKSLDVDNPEQAIRRLSTLQVRNQQTKPHLQSSYALELNIPSSEDQIRRGMLESGGNKENTGNGRQTSGSSLKQSNSANQLNQNSKRRIDDSAESKSPKKINTNGTLRQTNF